MNSQRAGLRVASIVFGLVCLAQLLRVVTGAEVVVADHHVPMAVSVVAIIVTGGLSAWMWRLS